MPTETLPLDAHTRLFYTFWSCCLHYCRPAVSQQTPANLVNMGWRGENREHGSAGGQALCKEPAVWGSHSNSDLVTHIRVWKTALGISWTVWGHGLFGLMKAENLYPYDALSSPDVLYSCICEHQPMFMIKKTFVDLLSKYVRSLKQEVKLDRL